MVNACFTIYNNTLDLYSAFLSTQRRFTSVGVCTVCVCKIKNNFIKIKLKEIETNKQKKE